MVDNIVLNAMTHTIFFLNLFRSVSDEELIVVGSNIDGYIPLRFEPGSVIYITGKPAVN